MKKALSEDELFFGLIIHDPCLFAEFFFNDELHLGLGFKQKMMFADVSPQQAICTARSVGKTTKMKAEYVRVALTMRGEGLFAFPAQRHMDPVREQVDRKINSVPLFRLMRTKHNKSEGVDVWGNGRWTWNWRIEGADGSDKNMVALHTKAIFGDEMAFGNMVCFQSRAMGALPGCRYIYAGVPNGWRGSSLYRLDQTRLGDGWSKHHMDRFDNPMYDSPEEKRLAINRSGGEHTQDYLTQVLGLWGDEITALFPPGAVAQDPTLTIFTAEWNYAYLQSFGPSLRSNDAVALLNGLPKTSAQRYVVGIDAGYSPDPAVFLIFYEGQEGIWYELAHIQLNSVPYFYQAKLLHALNEKLSWRIAAIAIEYVGPGIAVAQELLRSDSGGAFNAVFDYEHTVVNTNPGGMVDVDMAEMNRGVPQQGKDSYGWVKGDTTARIRRKVWLTEQIRLAMTRARNGLPGLKLWLGADTRLLDSVMNVAEQRSASGAVVYTGLDPTVQDHAVDALRSVMAAIDYANKKEPAEDAFGDAGAELGWVDIGIENWRAPWQLQLQE